MGVYKKRRKVSLITKIPEWEDKLGSPQIPCKFRRRGPKLVPSTTCLESADTTVKRKRMTATHHSHARAITRRHIAYSSVPTVNGSVAANRSNRK